MTENNGNENVRKALENIGRETANGTKKSLANSGIMLGLIGIGVNADSIALVSKFALTGIIEFAGNMLKSDSDIVQVEAELNKTMARAFSEFREKRQAAAKTEPQPANEPDNTASPETPVPDSPAAA